MGPGDKLVVPVLGKFIFSFVHFSHFKHFSSKLLLTETVVHIVKYLTGIRETEYGGTHL